YRPGVNVGMGKDHTLHALLDGTVRFERRSALKFTGQRRIARLVHIDPAAPKNSRRVAEATGGIPTETSGLHS
ncbi:50S ribosomal protein L27, partial [Candidatus Berkelbacteria bacterium]|nr:50S ribosomal protein L27 [Candidatus Berkelbacteria bacterium]